MPHFEITLSRGCTCLKDAGGVEIISAHGSIERARIAQQFLLPEALVDCRHHQLEAKRFKARPEAIQRRDHVRSGNQNSGHQLAWQRAWLT